MKRDSIYDNLSKIITEEQFENFFKNSYYSEEELKLVEKIAYSIPQDLFRKLFQMMRLNIIQPIDLTEITNFHSDAMSTWMDMKIENAYFFDYQSASLSSLIEVDSVISPLTANFYRQNPLTHTIKDYLFAFEYYSIANTDNSYKSKQNFIEDFKTKMGLNDPNSELTTLLTQLHAPLDLSNFSEDQSSIIQSLYQKLFTSDIIGDDDSPGLFSVETLPDLCFCSKLNLSSLQIYRRFFTDLINWQFPYTNFLDVREFLGEKFTQWNAVKDSVEEGTEPTHYAACLDEITAIINKDERISFYDLNRALICMCCMQGIQQDSMEDLLLAFEETIFNKISLMNQILNFIKNNVYSLKYTNV